MIKYIQLLVFSFLCNAISAQELAREYFFNDKLPINDSTSLIVIIKDAQTEIAKDIGHRIYTDTSFIKRVKNSFYEEYANDERYATFCGYDMYFYALSGNNLTHLNNLNSRCGIHQINCKTEEGLNILLESGKTLRVDTLYSFPTNMDSLKKILGSQNVIQSYYTTIEQWSQCASSRLPRCYYDGCFETKIVLDTSYSVRENIINFLKKYTSDISKINWNFWDSITLEGYLWGLRKFEKLREKMELELTFYLKKSDFQFFNIYTIEPVKNYKINKESPLLIFYKD